MANLQKKIFRKPITREELVNILAVFERHINEKIHYATRPWYVKLWRAIRGKRPATGRQNRPTTGRTAGSETRQPGPARGK